MPRPSTSTERRHRPGPEFWALLLTLASAVGGVASPPPDTAASPWGSARELAGRLAEERRKLDDLREGIQRLRFAAEDLRDLQLDAPADLHFQAGDAAAFDRRVEALENATRKTADRAEELGRALRDAIFVTREMAQGIPNRDMMKLLMTDNVNRIAAYLAVNREIQGRWDSALAVVREARRRSGISAPPSTGGAEDEFFRALRANTGTAAGEFQSEFQGYKDSLAARTAHREEWEQMARLDLLRAEQRIRAGAMQRPRERSWILEELERLAQRYSGRIAIGVIEHYLGEAWLESGQPLHAASAFARVESGSRMYAVSRLGMLRAFFAAGLDDSVVTYYQALSAPGAWPDSLRSPARFLAVQSEYALGRDSAIGPEVLSAKDRGPYYHRSLLIYAQSLVRQGRHAEARQVLAALSGQAQVGAGLRGEVEMDRAHLDYEDGAYEGALRGYQGLLNDSTLRPEALYGMVWCNIRLGDYDGAEFVLKQLITQHPDTPWAMDGFMVFIRKLMLKARDEWAYRLQVEDDAGKLRELQAKLAARRDSGAGDAEVRDLQSRVRRAQAALAKTQPLTPEQVAVLYQQALNLCDFVDERYRTGEYSQVGYSDDRAAVLAKLRVAESGAADSDSVAAGSELRRRMLEKLSQTRLLALNINLLHQSWLEDLLRYYETHLQADLAAARKHGDTAAVVKLQNQAQHLADQMSERIEAKSDDILDRITQLAADPAVADHMDWLLFQRGYLRYTGEEDALKRRLALNRMLAEADPDASPADRPLDAQRYEEPWLELLRRYPGSPYVPATLYFLGYARTAQGNADAGLLHFEALAARFPQSPYAQQALIFIGEHYFNDNDLARAEKAYDQVLDHPDSKYFDQALYKLAWTRYRASTYKSAISSFTYLLQEAQAQPKQGKSLLTQESLQYTALSLAESDTSGDDGFEKSEEFSRRLGDPRIGAELLHKMANIYLQQGRLDRAKRAFEALVKRYPTYDQLPAAEIELAQAYDKDQDFSQGAEIREKVFDHYAPGTAWYQNLKTPEARAAADTLLEHAMDEAARQSLYAAKQMPDSVAGGTAHRQFLYRKAIADYDRLLKAYPSHPHQARYLYQQAEAYYAMDDFAAAAKKYVAVSQTAAPPKLVVISAYNAIVAAQDLVRKAEGHEK